MRIFLLIIFAALHFISSDLYTYCKGVLAIVGPYNIHVSDPQTCHQQRLLKPDIKNRKIVSKTILKREM